MNKTWIILFLFYSTVHFCGCITISNIKKAKLERKPIATDQIVASNVDANGIAQIIFRFKSKTYSLQVPLDSIIGVFNNCCPLSYRNTDTASGFIGVNNNDSGRFLILYKLSALREIPGSNVDLKNDPVFSIYNSKVFIQNDLLDSTVHLDRTATAVKTIAFKYAATDTTTAYRKRRSNYLIAILPQQKRTGRYFLLPLTVPADAITLPFQAIGYGFIALLAWAMKF